MNTAIEQNILNLILRIITIYYYKDHNIMWIYVRRNNTIL